MNLPSEKELLRGWAEESTPKVSVVCIAYNHQEYIEDAIKGFLNQKTNFPFEIIIHDDCSTDDTLIILRKYQRQYPKIITLIEKNENSYSKVGFLFVKDIFSVCSGEYIAFCEGDDYWIDENKLFKQVAILDSNSSVSICLHNAYLMDMQSGARELFNKKEVPKFLNVNHVIFRKWFSPTASFVMRRAVLDFPMVSGINLDIALLFNLSLKGSICYINEPMSIYRYGSVGSLSSNSKINYNGIVELYLKKEKFLKYVLTRVSGFSALLCILAILKVKIRCAQYKYKILRESL